MDLRGQTQIGIAPVTCDDFPAMPAAAEPLMQYLIVVRGGIPGTMYRLAKGCSTLGRALENTCQLSEGTISRRHASIAIDGQGAAWITDLGSSNGTFVEGRRLTPHAPLRVRDGNRIQVGSTTLLKFVTLDSCEEGFQREMYERAVRDQLTGLYNRGYFLNQVGALADRNAPSGLGLAVLLADIDRFKLINDTHGHDAGDRVLRKVAAILRDSTRSEDLVARYGGEEFVLALPIGSAAHALERAERIRASLAASPLAIDGGAIPVTVSLGLAFRPAGAVVELVELIKAADRALYEAKRTGRNRVVCAKASPSRPAAKTESVDGFFPVLAG
ncbi:Response regulator PleD [Aquisphaera giovannonii]|uniref:diguanylate cyclase n=1 Tax=Aquisphaera giovannonii TaxID=406548 RepID=A0A5B9W1E8_9BACT|nr:GGDEF domain-containing protein [Aquisphaera giovannonii]QEH34054.1 Response regulator PleD [Aquisphaera giovannonii]